MSKAMPRYKRDGLPRRVYRKHGAFYYVDRANKWHRLGATESEMYAALARLTGEDGRTLGAVMDRYMREVMPGKAPQTQKNQAREMEVLRAVFGKLRPEQIKTQDVARYLDRRGGVKANREVALLSHVFTKAIRWGLCETNPCTGVERNTPPRTARYVTDAEFWARWEQCPDVLRLLMEALYLTGQRLGDVLKIRESDISEDGISIRQGKTGTGLVLGWTPALRALVDRCRATKVTAINAPLIRRRDGQSYTVSGIGSMFRRIPWGDAEPFTLRDLRAKSASDHPDGSHLGHRDPRTLERFYLRKPKEVRGL